MDKNTPIIVETVKNGNYIDLNNFTKDMIRIEDIVVGLARQFRFNGLMPLSLDLHYSVAEHSTHVMEHISRLQPCDYSPLDSLETEMIALCHDMSEAYLGDMPSPIKAQLPDYQKLEARVQKTIYDYFDCKVDNPSYMKTMEQADYRMLLIEMRHCGKHALKAESDKVNYQYRLKCLSPEKAAIYFKASLDMCIKNRNKVRAVYAPTQY
ncbi:MAG: HD domain-containing protein [Rhizobiales bacterium]|nr:HD domain-containing protein [Hyphomicrobiales bacterium]